MISKRPALAAVTVVANLATVSVVVAQPPPAPQLTGTPALVRVYDAIFDARFDDIPELITAACPPAPVDACRVLEAAAVLWRIQIDPANPNRDSAFHSTVETAIAATEAWSEREPDNAEAYFYLGGAYGARAQWRVLRGQRVPAARDGKRIKDALEHALAIDPRLREAQFGIGLYHYYADVAPWAAKILRWLLLLPGGSREAGLREMLQGRAEATLLRDEADYQLHLIYLWYEQQPEKALELLQSLRSRHPRNPLFLQLIAQVQDRYLHDVAASLRTYLALLEAAQSARVELPVFAEATGRLGAAQQLDRLFESDLAINHLQAVITSRPTEPYDALKRARAQLRQATRRMEDPAYRQSIEGWRALQNGDLSAAARLLSAALALRPNDPVTRVRNAQLLVADGDDTGALTLLDPVLRARDSTPPSAYATACLQAAGVHERRRETGRAMELYRTARDIVGADQETRDAAERALSRLAL